jgi:hypothetical protein
MIYIILFKKFHRQKFTLNSMFFLNWSENFVNERLAHCLIKGFPAVPKAQRVGGHSLGGLQPNKQN